MTENPLVRKKLRWQFSLRTLVILLVASGAISFVLSIANEYRQEQKVVELIQAVKGKTHYDYEFKNGEFLSDGKPKGPKWLQQRFGKNVLSRVTYVEVHQQCDQNTAEWLSLLRHLELLILFDCDDLDSLNCLRRIDRLKYLDLGACGQLSDILNFEKAEQLEHVDLFNCDQIDDFSPLSELKKLGYLNLSDCEKLTSLENISSLPNLETLKLINSNLTDLDGITSFPNLLELHLDSSNQLAEVSGVESLHRLRVLNLLDCPKISNDQISRLKSQLPDTLIHSDH